MDGGDLTYDLTCVFTLHSSSQQVRLSHADVIEASAQTLDGERLKPVLCLQLCGVRQRERDCWLKWFHESAALLWIKSRLKHRPGQKCPVFPQVKTNTQTSLKQQSQEQQDRNTKTWLLFLIKSPVLM